MIKGKQGKWPREEGRLMRNEAELEHQSFMFGLSHPEGKK